MHPSRWRRNLPIAFMVIGLLAAGGSLAYSVWAATSAVNKIESESRDRRSQSCVVAEGQERDARKKLAGTYEYLLALSPAERRTTLTRFVLRALPDQEQQARHNVAPPFCHEPGIGLPPQAIPPFPKRPRGITVLLKKS